MTPDKMTRSVESLNAMARKVFEAVPLGEAWTTNQVVIEMRRSGVCGNPDYAVIEGCLNTLTEQGIVRERPRGMFQRVATKAAAVSLVGVVVPTDHIVPLSADKLAPQVETLDKLAEVSRGLRALAATLEAAARSIDDTAIEVEERIQQANAAGRQMQELRKLLMGS